MKKLLAILLVVATLFCVAACDNDTDTTTTTAADSTTTTTAADDNTTTTVKDDNTTTTVKDDNTTTTVEDDSTTTTKKEETTKGPGIKGVNPADSKNWMQVVNGVYTSDKGGLQMKAEGWKTYNLYSISFVPVTYDKSTNTNAVCVSVYDADTPDVFAAKTKEDFESVLKVGLDTFEPTTICGYPAYVATFEGGDAVGAYYVWVINTPVHKYFINFMQAPLDKGGYPFAAEAAQFMSSVVIYK